MHLVGFITRLYHDARSPERQIFHNKSGSKNCVKYFMSGDEPTRLVTCRSLIVLIQL